MGDTRSSSTEALVSATHVTLSEKYRLVIQTNFLNKNVADKPAVVRSAHVDEPPAKFNNES